MATPALQPTGQRLKIEVEKQDRPRLWTLIAEKKWSGEYVGKNVFIFTDEQISEIRKAEIRFRQLS